MKICFVALLILLLAPHQAMALICAQSVVDEATIEQTDLIFEGKILKILDKKENKNSEAPINKYTVYKFSVEKMWKGEITSKEVYISKNTYWGDSFKIDTPYLVFANKNGEYFESAVCGNTKNLNYADDEITTLKNYISANEEEN